MSLKVEIKNVGGLFNKNITIEQGVNRIRAPNAVGKTSFTKSLELLTFSQSELRGKGSYSNLFAGSEEPTKVKLSGDINHERIFRRIGKNDLREIGTEPLIVSNGKRVVDVCFAMPGNSLIEDFIAGKDVKSYVELLAGSKSYEKAIKAVNEISRTIKTKIQHYNDSLIRLEESQKQIAENEEDLKKLEKEFSKMPLLDEEDVFKDHKFFLAKENELRELNETIATKSNELENLKERIEDTKQEIKWLDSQIQLIKSRSPRIDARLDWIAKEILEKKKQLEEVKTDRSKTQDKINSAQRNEVSLTKYGDEGLCYACGKHMSREDLYSWTRELKKDISELNTLNTQLKREIEDLMTEQTQLKEDKQELGKYEDLLDQKQKSLTNREGEAERTSKLLNKLGKQVDVLMDEIHELSKSEDAYNTFKSRQEMKVRIDQKEENIKRIEKRFSDIKNQMTGIDDLQDKQDYINSLNNYLESRKNQIVEDVRRTFDEKVSDLYKKLGYKDFDDIAVGPDFRVSVTRKKDGRIVENFPLEALSTSERITIAIAFLLAAKEEYVNDFPFFVLDEIITSYDPERFQIIKEYLRNSEDYIIITELAADTTDVEVIHDVGTATAK